MKKKKIGGKIIMEELINSWRLIYNATDNEYPNATGDEIMKIATEKLQKIIEEVLKEVNKWWTLLNY